MNADNLEDEVSSWRRAQAHRVPSMAIEDHHGRASRMDTDFGTCLGCMKELQPLKRIVTAGGHKWRCPECEGVG